MSKLTVYSTQSCATCGTAKRRLDAAGIPYEPVLLEDDPAAHQRLKDAGFLQVPVFGWKGSLYTIAGLSGIEAEAQAEIASKLEAAA